MSVSAQYAASARGKCAKCQGKIDKDELVIVVGQKRYQLDCVPADEDIATEDITGLSALQKADLDKIEKKFGKASSAQRKKVASKVSSDGGRPKRSASVVSKKKSDAASSDAEDDDDSAKAPAAKKKRSAPAPKKKQQPKKSKKDASDSEGDEEGSGDDSEHSDAKPAKKTKAAPAKKKAKAEPKSKFKLPTDIAAKIRDAKEQLEDKTIDELKEILSKNDQTKTGTKKELIEKAADGMVQGRIPRCPKCHAGKPKYDAQTGLYTCKGYMDDEAKFHFCKFKSADLKREPWEN